jgi:nitric oxide reductase NorE protein
VTPELAKGPRRTPGEQGVWVLILGDLLIFSLFFITLLYYGRLRPEIFARGQMSLNFTLGLLNSLLLITSSLMAAMGVEATREASPKARGFFSGAMLCGLGFVAIKSVEYMEKLHAGISLVSSEFFTFYFVFTGIHLSHVLAGLGVLAFIRCGVAGQAMSAQKLSLIESGVLFWHMVDLLWVMLFSLFYILEWR